VEISWKNVSLGSPRISMVPTSKKPFSPKPWNRLGSDRVTGRHDNIILNDSIALQKT
jgi:hypothetical protein